MNRLNNKKCELYNNITNSYGELVKSSTSIATINCNISEKKTELATDKASSVYSDYLGITSYKAAKVGQTLVCGSDSYIITSVINSTRMAQLGLKKK